MKLIERGKNDWHRIKCQFCHSILEIEEGDLFTIKTAPSPLVEDDCNVSAYVKCMVCKEAIRTAAPDSVIRRRVQIESMIDDYL